jgi:hypothetical protein
VPRSRREVRRSAQFLAHARQLYPPGGSPDGRPPFELFEERILRAAELQFALDFEDLPVAIEEVPAIRHVMTHAVPYFPALVIYAILLSDDAVEILDLDVDETYWDLIGDDPVD